MSQIECEIYKRCVGYYRPVSQMNPGKAAEASERKEFFVNPGGRTCLTGKSAESV